MKGMTSASFNSTAPSAVVSSSIPTGTFTLDSYPSNSTESFKNCLKDRYYCGFSSRIAYRCSGVRDGGMYVAVQQPRNFSILPMGVNYEV